MSTYLPRIFSLVRVQTYNLKDVSQISPLVSITIFFMLSDAILSYAVPVYVDSLFGNEFIVGLIIALSSVAGFLFDFLSKKLMGHKDYKSFISLTLIFALVFSISLRLAFEFRYLILLSMAAWGIYYETLAFANYKFLKARVASNMYTTSWSIITALKSLLYTLGPLLSGYLIVQNLKLPIYFSLGVLAVLALIFAFLYANKKSHLHIQSEVKTSMTKYHELKIWLVILKRLYPIWLLNLTLVIIDACFWTTGVIFSERVGVGTPIARLFIPLYVIPALLLSPVSAVITSRIGKKTTAIAVSAIGSLFLISFGLFHQTNMVPILIFVFLYAVCISIVFPAIYSAFEDYVLRLGSYDTDFIGLEQASSSIGYVIGPILAGFISFKFGQLNTFMAMGLLLVCVAIAAGILAPKKIKMPHAELLKVS